MRAENHESACPDNAIVRGSLSRLTARYELARNPSAGIRGVDKDSDLILIGPILNRRCLCLCRREFNRIDMRREAADHGAVEPV